MDPLICVLWIVVGLLLLGIVLHPAFGVAGYVFMIAGTLWVTR